MESSVSPRLADVCEDTPSDARDPLFQQVTSLRIAGWDERAERDKKAVRSGISYLREQARDSVDTPQDAADVIDAVIRYGKAVAHAAAWRTVERSGARLRSAMQRRSTSRRRSLYDRVLVR